MDLDLVQALHQTETSLDRGDDLPDHARQVREQVVGLLDHYREHRRGDVAYSEEGADRIDRTGGGTTEQKERVQAALIAYHAAPSDETARHATDALRQLSSSV